MKTIKVKSTSSNDKVTHSVIEKELDRLKKRMSIANLSKATIISYCRGLKKLYDFHKSDPRQLEYDEIIDFLIYLKDDLDLQWRTIKLYVAGLRYYYQEIVEDADLSRRIPYPNDERTIP